MRGGRRGYASPPTGSGRRMGRTRRSVARQPKAATGTRPSRARTRPGRGQDEARTRPGRGESMTTVRKAVIPAAGLGTRFLPATKAQPKEMLPILDKPAIQYVVEEAVRC